MLGEEKSSEYVLAELLGEPSELDFGKGLFEQEPTFTYLDPTLMIPTPPPPPPPPPPPLPPLPSMVRSQSLDDLKNLEELEPLGLDSGVHSKCPTPVPVDLWQISMEIPMYLMQEDEGNDEEIMRLLGVSNSSPSSSNLSESSSDSGNASAMQLSDSVAGDQMGECDYHGVGLGIESSSGCGSDMGGGLIEVLDGHLCSPEILEQLMFMEIDCGDTRDDITARSLEELVSQVATGTFDQSASRVNSAGSITTDPTSDHQFQTEVGPVHCDDNDPEKVLPTMVAWNASLSSRTKLSFPVRQSSPTSDSGNVDTLSLTSSEPSISPVNPSGSSMLPTDQDSLPIRPMPLPAFPTYSVAVPKVDLASSSSERAVLTLQATPILSVEHTASVPQASRNKHPTAKSRLPGGWPKGKKRKTEKEMLKPPKPPITSYRAFMRDKQPGLMAQGEPGSLQMVSKKLGQMWGNLCAGDRAEYVRQAEEDRNRYVSELKEYMKRALEDISPSQEVLHMFILDSFREADSDELHCHVCQLPFTNTSSKQAHFCGRPHSAEVINKLFSVLGCSNRGKRGRRGKSTKDPGSTYGLVSRNNSATTSESSMPLHAAVAKESASVPLPPPVGGLSSRQRHKVRDTTGSTNGGLSSREQPGLKPSLLPQTQPGQDVLGELGRLMMTPVSHSSLPFGTAVESSCMSTCSNPTYADGIEQLSLMDIVTVTDQLLMEGLSHMNEFGTVERDDHPSQPLTASTLSQ